VPTPSKTEAIAILEREHRSVGDLMARVGPDDFTRPATIGGGDWSAKDLMGHLTSWEEHAIRALEAWAAGEPSPVQRALRIDGLNAVNASSVAEGRTRSADTVRERFVNVHRRLLAEIRTLADADWERPPTPRSRRSLAHVLGGIVGGPAGPFAHASAHLPDLWAFVDAVTDPERAAPRALGTPGPGD
jgi:Mycothiol maleylpyruvate isomerase N-terminal domain